MARGTRDIPLGDALIPRSTRSTVPRGIGSVLWSKTKNGKIYRSNSLRVKRNEMRDHSSLPNLLPFSDYWLLNNQFLFVPVLRLLLLGIFRFVQGNAAVPVSC